MVTSGAEIQPDKNWTKVHNSILELLATTNFTARELRCLLFLFRQTYGYQCKESAISLTEWEQGTRLKRGHVSTTLKELVARNVVSRTETGERSKPIWAFNKYFEQWQPSTPLGTSFDGPPLGTTPSTDLGTTPSTPLGTLGSTPVQCVTTPIKEKRNSKEQGEETPAPVGPTFSERNANGYFGMPTPFNGDRVVADGYTQDAAKEGVDAATYRAMFDAMIDAAGWRAIVDAGDDRKLNFAKQDALMLIRIDAARNLEQLTRLIAAYRTAYPRKTTYPRDIAEYASQIKAGMTPQAYTNGSNTPVYDSPRKRMKDLTNG